MGEDPEKTKKIILFAIIGIAVFAVILIVILSIFSSMAASRNNIIIDGTSSKIDETILTTDELGNVYFSIEKMAPLLSYEFYNGEYGKATEDRTKCYVKNADELAAFDMNSSVIYKLVLANADNLYEKYTLTNSVKRIDNNLYVSLQGMKKAFNVDAVYDAEKNVLTINTLPYLYNAFNSSAKELGYTSLAEEFTNKKAILNGFLVVVKDREYYGVISTTGETIIGTKYKKIEFLEETNEFLAQSNNKYGILTSNAETKIDLVYDELKIIDSEIGLYLAKSNERYGVLKRDGSVLLYTQYDYIGVKDVDYFPNDDIRNPYIILDSVIPVTKDGKVGFYSVDGSTIMEPTRLTTLGCISTTNKTDAYKNVLIIPESEGAEGLVVGITNGTNTTTYGIYSPRTKKQLTPTTFSRIYRDVVNGEVSYYMVFGGTVSTVKSRLTTSATNVNGNNTTVNVNELITTPTNTIDNTVGTNTIGNNIVGTNTVGTNTIGTNTVGDTPTSNATSMPTPTQSGNAILIDTNSTEPIVVQ